MNRVDRRTFLAGLGTIAAGGVVAACGAPSSGAQKGGDKTVKSLTYTTNSDDATSKAEIPKWNATHSTKVKLETSSATQYQANFSQLAISSNAPNIAGFFIDGGHYADLASAGALVDLTALWQSTGLDTAVPENIHRRYFSFTKDKKAYAVPTNVSQYAALFYRKSVFQKAGVDLPEKNRWESLDQFTSACDKFKKAGIDPISIGGKDGYPISHMQDGILSSFMTSEEIEAPLSIDYTGDKWLTPIQTMIDWNHKGYISRGFLGRATDQALQIFAQGRCAMYTANNVWQILLQQAGIPLSDVGFVLFPQVGPLPAKISVYSGGGLLIPAAAQGHDEAEQFVSWAVSPPIALFAAQKSGAAPARTDVPGLEKALGAVAGPMLTFAALPNAAQTGWDDPAPTDMINYDRANLQAVLAGTQTAQDFGKMLNHLRDGHK